MRRGSLILAALLSFSAPASAAVLNANSTSNNGGSSGWAIFFDLSSIGGQPLIVTDMTTASSAAANAAFSVEVFTRTGTALGGPLGSGPGSSPAGWTSLGSAPATQGPTLNGISTSINIPDISVAASGITGVALKFTGAGPRYMDAATYQVFSDANLSLTTGDSRTVPFTTTGSFFSPRAMTGSLTYTFVPEPASLGVIAIGVCAVVRRRR